MSILDETRIRWSSWHGMARHMAQELYRHGTGLAPVSPHDKNTTISDLGHFFTRTFDVSTQSHRQTVRKAVFHARRGHLKTIQGPPKITSSEGAHAEDRRGFKFVHFLFHLIIIIKLSLVLPTPFRQLLQVPFRQLPQDESSSCIPHFALCALQQRPGNM